MSVLATLAGPRSNYPSRPHVGLDLGVNRAAIENETLPIADAQGGRATPGRCEPMVDVLCRNDEAQVMRDLCRGWSIVSIASWRGLRAQADHAAGVPNRFLLTEEIAQPLLWLGSDEASLRTGQAPAVDGGYRAL